MSPEPSHLDCEIRVLNREQVSVRAAGKESSGRVALDQALEQRLWELLLEPMEYGKALFDALLPSGSDLLTAYRETLALTLHADKILRVRLFIEPTAPPELHRFLWERLYDAKRGSALACSREVSLSRSFGVQEAGELLKEKLKLLVVIANPSDLETFKLASVPKDASRRAIEAALEPLSARMSWEVLDEPATAERISDRLIGGKFHALHIQGHGLVRTRDDAPSMHLVLEKPDGTADFVGEDYFSQIFEGNRSLRLVTLIACHGGHPSGEDPLSGLGPGLVRRGIPAVLAMGQAIRVDTAGRFCQHFYRNLARSGMVDRAVNEARHQLLLSRRDSEEWATPILFMGLHDGRLLDVGLPPVVAADGQGKPVKWKDLLDLVKADRFVPILGPGVTRGLLLSPEEIALHWVSAYDGFPPDRRIDLPAVAQFVESKGFPFSAHDQLPRLLIDDLLGRENVQQRQPLQDLTLSEVIEKIAQRHFDPDANEPHWLLASLDISTYVTTNCDSFLVEALRRRKRNVQRHYCLWRKSEKEIEEAGYHELKGTKDNPLVFHLYGNDEDTQSLVLTENNYLDFLWTIAREPSKIPLELGTKLTQSMLVFLGYDFRGLDCRVLLRGIVAQLKALGRGRIAILQVDDDDEEAPRVRELRSYIEECCVDKDLRIEVYWGSVRSFLVELTQRLGGTHGNP